MRTPTAMTFALATSLVAALSSTALAEVRYGILCGSTYDNNWVEPLGDPFGGCTGLHQALAPLGTRVFYWGLNFGEVHAIEENSPWEDFVEDTDLTYLGTHGGAWSRFGASLTGQRQLDRAMSKKVKLGDEGRGTSILVLASCTTLAPYAADENGAPGPESWWNGRKKTYPAADDIFARWSKTMRSGLRMIVGSWDVLHANTHGFSTSLFGSRLASGLPIWEAWRGAINSFVSSGDPAVFAAGTSETDCFNRIDTMKITNLTSYQRLRDNQIGSMCWKVDF